MTDANDALAHAAALARQGRHEEALRAYLDVLERDERCVEAAWGAGLMSLELEDWAQARAMMERVLALDADHRLAAVWLARLQHLQASERELIDAADIPDLDADLRQPAATGGGVEVVEDWSAAPSLGVRQRRAARRLRVWLMRATVLLVAALAAGMVATLGGWWRTGDGDEARPELPRQGKVRIHTGVYHYLVPGLFLGLDQQGDTAKVHVKLSLHGPLDEARVFSGKFDGDILHCGSLWLRMRDQGWTGDVSLGMAAVRGGLERVRTEQEVRGWELLGAGRTGAALRRFLAARGRVMAAPGPLAGQVAVEYAEGRDASVRQSVALALQHPELAHAPVTRDYLLHLAESAYARQMSADDKNGMDSVLAALAALPQEGLQLSSVLAMVARGEATLAPAMHEAEIRRLSELARPAMQALRPLQHQVYSYLAEDLRPERLQRAWERYQSLARLNDLAQVGALSARLESVHGRSAACRESLRLIALMGLRLLQAGLAGDAALHSSLDVYESILRSDRDLDADACLALLKDLDVMRQQVSWERPQEAQRGNLVALLGLISEPRDGAYLAAQQLALARLDLVAIAAAVRFYQLGAGRLPATLAELEGEHLKGGIRDRFDGGELRYQLGQGVALLYSVGPDGVDDGGKAQVGHNRANPISGDIVVRLPISIP